MTHMQLGLFEFARATQRLGRCRWLPQAWHVHAFESKTPFAGTLFMDSSLAEATEHVMEDTTHD